MSSFSMGGTSEKLGNTDFGAIQAMHKKQEEKTAKEKEAEENSFLKTDTLTISDEAKSKITSSIGQLGDNKSSGASTAATANSESAEDSESAEGAGTVKSSLSGAAEEEGSKEADSLEASIKKMEAQIKAKEAEIQALMSDGSEEGKQKAALLLAEVSVMRSTLSSLESKQAEAKQEEAKGEEGEQSSVFENVDRALDQAFGA